jgi:hypothetical protein
MEGLEYDPDMIVDKEISTNLSKGIFPPIFHKFRSRGIYVLKYFKDLRFKVSNNKQAHISRVFITKYV